jgi:hypothetical protein
MSKSLALDSYQKKIDAYRAGFNYYTTQHINHRDPEPQDNANNYPYYYSYWIEGFQGARHGGLTPEDYSSFSQAIGGKSRKIRTRKSKRRKSYKRRR